MSQEDIDFANHSCTSYHSNFPLLLKCGLLQRLCSESSTSSSISGITSSSPIVLPDFPGGEAAFELCTKFCYNISITLSAHNFIPAFSAATCLLMTDSASCPNFLPKLHTFFVSFILPNWKDSVVALISSSHSSPPFSEPAIIRPLIDSIITKILTPASRVTWSFTYSRRLSQSSVPKDWWTEDIADLDLSYFRYIISSIKSSKILLPPALIGEALHVYTVKNLPDPNVAADLRGKDQRVLGQVAEARKLLGFSPYSRPSLSQIKAAYRKKVLESHPDRVPVHEKAQAESKFKLISEAYSSLQAGVKLRNPSEGTYVRVVRTGVPGAYRSSNKSLIKAPFLLLIFGTISLGGINAARAYQRQKEANPSDNPFLP